jgi:hypothetical protein
VDGQYNRNMKEIRLLSLHSPFDWRKPKRYLCFLIRFITGSYWNHSAIFLKEGENDYIIEADTHGVSMIPFENYKRHGTIKLSDKTFLVEYERIKTKIGVAKYDFRNLIIHQTLKEVFGIFITPKQGRKGERFTCSEFVAYVLDLPEPWTYTPRQISEL